MKPENEISAHNIKALRLLENLTQDEFGKKYNSNQKSVWAYEAGNIQPGKAFTIAISNAYRIYPEDLTTKKLRINKDGHIANIPKADNQLSEARTELKTLFDDFQKSVNIFYKGVDKLNQKIDRIERNVHKK